MRLSLFDVGALDHFRRVLLGHGRLPDEPMFEQQTLVAPGRRLYDVAGLSIHTFRSKLFENLM